MSAVPGEVVAWEGREVRLDEAAVVAVHGARYPRPGRLQAEGAVGVAACDLGALFIQENGLKEGIVQSLD